MAGRTQFGGFLALVFFATACAGPSTGPVSNGGRESQPAQLKSIRLGVMGAAGSFGEGTEQVPGKDELTLLVNSGLVQPDRDANLLPILAESVPTVENGSWKVFPDGRMETSWTIRQGAQWHDGAPFTTADLLFTANIDQDPALPLFGKTPYRYIENIEAVDAQRIVAKWNRPFISADRMFSMPGGRPGFPMPKHLLEKTYLENKEALLGLPYWTTEFVGTGPFKLREWVGGTHVLLEANERWVLGRPKIDRIEVKFIPNSNTLVANILAGEVELVIGRNISVEQGLALKRDWRGGTVDFGYFDSLAAMFPQLIDPVPQVLTDVQFRRALTHAIDREALADTLMGGVVPAAHGFFSPQVQVHRENAVIYEYDPRRATRLIEELGFTRAADGVFQNRSGQILESTEVRFDSERDLYVQLALAAVDYWKAIGVPGHVTAIPTGVRVGRDYTATRPAFTLTRRATQFDRVQQYFGPPIPTPENNWAGAQLGRYDNSEFFGLIERFFTTVSAPERLKVEGQIVRHMTGVAFLVPLVYDAEPAPIGNRLRNVHARGLGENSMVFNVHQWDAQ